MNIRSWMVAAWAAVQVFAAGMAWADPVDEVDVFIGTGGNGHTTPAAAYPLGLVQAGPDTGRGQWRYCSGYNFEDASLCGFSQTHLNGTGCLDLGDIRLLPFAGGETPESVAFDKASETASPGYYAVTLADGTRVEVTVSPHAAIYRIRYASGGRKRLLFDFQWGIVSERGFEKHIKSFDLADETETGLSGVYTAQHWSKRTCAFDIAFDHPRASREFRPPRSEAKAPSIIYDFELSVGEPLCVKIALSAKGVEGARRNLKAEIPAWDFEGVRTAARAAWNGILSRTAVKGSKEERATWYTGIYHLYFQPNNIADVGEKPFYSTFSCWDTFRAAGPLYTILTPEINATFVDSMLRQGEITGYLPIWTLWGFDNQCMIGTHSIPMIVDQFLKNGKGEREKTYWERAYRQIKETLTKTHESRRKERWDLYDTYGYYPCDVIRGESVSRTVECGYDDWCAAQMATALGHTEDAAFFMKRSNYWKNVFDPEIRMLRGKNAKGAWRTPYNPYALGHNTDRDNDFTEGNAFHYTWHVLQDPEGLIAAMGGRAAFVKDLDALFTRPTEVEGMGTENDCTGQIGQYAHGNEPSHHVAYLYTLAGRPDKTAAQVREICEKFYQAKPEGLCGNEDCGQMSAWYLFSAMGFYPLNPCGGEYVLGAPQLERVEVKVGDGKTFTVVAKGLSKENLYVKSVSLNGQPITDGKIRHADIMAGGELVFEMARTLEVTVWRGETRTLVLDDGVEIGSAPTGVAFTEGRARNVRWSEKKPSKKDPKKKVVVRHQLADRVEWGSTAQGPRVLSIAVQADAKPGTYAVGDLKLTILDRELPSPKDWKYALDLWQHPWAVARVANVEPFSSEHYAAMKPIWEQLAAAGQKALTVTLLDLPWNHQCYDGYYSMIRHIKQADGTWKFDYSIFDEYVAFGRSCGIGPDIACYTMCPWGYKVTWENEAGEKATAKAVPGTDAFADYWGDFLVDFAKHLKEKGWFDDTYLAMDERKPEDVKNICEFIQQKAPGLKTSLCGNRAPSEFEGIRLDYVCFGLNHLTDKLIGEAAARRKAGMRTTYYVCCSPRCPNTMCHNRAEEAFWLGVYPAMAGLDGFLRWAWNSWPKEPMKDATFGNWPAGDTFLIYPDNSPSLRFLALKNGIIAAEKIRILQEQGFFTEELATLAVRFDRTAALKNETDFKALEADVQRLVNHP